MANTVSKDSIAYKEFMAMVAEFGGWVENEELCFPNEAAKLKFEHRLAYHNG